MKRVIFSVYQEVKDNTVTSYKKQQLDLYKEKLAKRQQKYAKFCNADYFVYETDDFLVDDYTSIQFMKIKQFEELAEEYDEVLYLDLDIIPFRFVNFFEEHDLSKICCLKQDGEEWGLKRYFSKKDVKYQYQVNRRNFLHFDKLDSQNWWVKACSKNAMLLLENYSKFNNMLINTGVLGGNSKSIKELKFTENLNRMIELSYQAKEDNLYPDEISNFMKPNNEVFLSYLSETNNIDINELDEKWNYILDDMRVDFDINEIIFLHVINKKFNEYESFFQLF